MSFIAVSAVNEDEHITVFGRGETPEEAFNDLNIAESNEAWEDDDELVREAVYAGYIEVNVYEEELADVEATLTTFVVEGLLERIAENAYDIVGDASDDYLNTNNIPKEALEELRSELVCIVTGWADRHKLTPNFFSLGKKVKTFKVPYPLNRCCTQEPEIKVGDVYAIPDANKEFKEYTYIVTKINTYNVELKSYFTRATEKYAFDENVRSHVVNIKYFLENYRLVEPKPEEFMHFRTRPSKEVSQAIYNAVTCDYREAALAIQSVDKASAVLTWKLKDGK